MDQGGKLDGYTHKENHDKRTLGNTDLCGCLYSGNEADKNVRRACVDGSSNDNGHRKAKARMGEEPTVNLLGYLWI